MLVLRATAGNGKELYTLAQELREKGITGNYAADNSSYSEVQRLAYFTGSIFYSLSRLNYTNDELLDACRENNINYYFFYAYTPGDVKEFTSSALYRQAAGQIITQREGLILVKLR